MAANALLNKSISVRHKATYDLQNHLQPLNYTGGKVGVIHGHGAWRVDLQP